MERQNSKMVPKIPSIGIHIPSLIFQSNINIGTTVIGFNQEALKRTVPGERDSKPQSIREIQRRWGGEWGWGMEGNSPLLALKRAMWLGMQAASSCLE